MISDMKLTNVCFCSIDGIKYCKLHVSSIRATGGCPSYDENRPYDTLQNDD